MTGLPAACILPVKRHRDPYAEMLLEERKENGAAVVKINAPRLEARIADQLAEEIIEAYKPVRALVIDFSGVGFIDSVGMKAVMSVLLYCRKTEGACVLCGVSEDIMSVFVITRLNRLLPIVDTQAEALARVLELKEQSRLRAGNI